MKYPHSPEPTATLELVTPERAHQWMDANFNNRPIRERKVARYSSEMLDERWVVTGEGVKFDVNGRMFDGQHRLLAIIRSGEPVWMFVFRNLPPKAAAAVDTGAKRSPKDALHWAGYAGETELASVAKVVILWHGGALRRSSASGGSMEVTSQDVLEWVKVNADSARNWISWARRIYAKGQGFPTISKATLAAALFIIAEQDAEGAEMYASQLQEMRLPGKGHPLNTLHQRIISAKSRKETIRMAGQLFLYFRTWNAIADGERLSQLKIGKVGDSKGGLVDIIVPSPKARGTRAVA